MHDHLLSHVASMCACRDTRRHLGFHIDKCLTYNVKPLPVTARRPVRDAIARKDDEETNVFYAAASTAVCIKFVPSQERFSMVVSNNARLRQDNPRIYLSPDAVSRELVWHVDPLIPPKHCETQILYNIVLYCRKSVWDAVNLWVKEYT